MKFRLHWDADRSEVVEGDDIADAFTKAGYGAGAIAALDYYEPVEESVLVGPLGHEPETEEAAKRMHIAPPGMYRLLKECMEDGHLQVLADCYNYPFARSSLQRLREEDSENVFTLWDDHGESIGEN